MFLLCSGGAFVTRALTVSNIAGVLRSCKAIIIALLVAVSYTFLRMGLQVYDLQCYMKRMIQEGCCCRDPTGLAPAVKEVEKWQCDPSNSTLASTDTRSVGSERSLRIRAENDDIRKGYVMTALAAVNLEEHYSWKDYLAWPDSERWDIVAGKTYAMREQGNSF
jgi:hypothetical protein